jgi:hypothetical protein
MKRRTVILFGSWAQVSLATMTVATAAVGLLYGAICLVEAACGAIASEAQK